MKKAIFISAVVFLVAVLFLVNTAHADLNLIGQGTSTHGTYNLIYDTDLDVTWYDFSNPVAYWQNQLDWASALSVNFGGNTYEDWRLPSTLDGVLVEGYDGTTTGGYNITSSEMGHLYYSELGNEGYFDTSGNPTGCSVSSPYCLTSTGDFQNLQPMFYWSGTENAAVPSWAWGLYLTSGLQYVNVKGASSNYALAVRDGLAVVPEPISSILFITGGATLGLRRFCKKRKTASEK